MANLGLESAISLRMAPVIRNVRRCETFIALQYEFRWLTFSVSKQCQRFNCSLDETREHLERASNIVVAAMTREDFLRCKDTKGDFDKFECTYDFGEYYTDLMYDLALQATKHYIKDFIKFEIKRLEYREELANAESNE